jgi:hypothetical protein
VKVPGLGIERWDLSLVKNRPARGDHLSRRNAVRQTRGDCLAANPANCSCFQRHGNLECRRNRRRVTSESEDEV